MMFPLIHGLLARGASGIADPLSEFSLVSTVDESHSGMPSRMMDAVASNDGANIYVTSFDSSQVRRFSTSAPFDPTTMTLVSTESLSISQPFAGCLSGDGVYLYTTSNSTKNVYRYTLSTPFEPTTAGSIQSKSLTVSSNPHGVRVSSDGVHLHVVNGGDIEWFVMSDPYNLNTAVSQGVYDLAAYGYGSACCFNSDGSRMYLTTADDIMSFTVGTPYDPSTLTPDPTSISLSSILVNHHASDNSKIWVDPTEMHMIIAEMGYYGNGGVYYLSRSGV